MIGKRVVITGLGVVSAIGIGKDSFFESLFKGVSGIKPVSSFETEQFKSKLAGEIPDFSAQDFLGEKGLRTLDRSTKLLCSATKLALDDAGFIISEENTHETGVAVGATFGSLKSISDFDRDSIVDGARYVNPALFPNTVINSPASQVSIKFNIKGFNATVSTGFCASLDAINYAADFIRLGRAKIVLSGGVEELCIQTYLGFYKSGCLSGSNSILELSCPFDKRRNGAILGEGSCMVVLEDLESALERKANIYAEVLGFGSRFGQDGAFQEAIEMSIASSGLEAQEINFVSAAANSTQDIDSKESAAIKQTLGKIPVSSMKGAIGETFSASGSFQVASAVGAIKKQAVFPTLNYKETDPACDVNVVNAVSGLKIENVLVNNIGPTGNNSSLVISKFK